MDPNAQNQSVEQLQQFARELVEKRFNGEDLDDDVKNEMQKEVTGRLSTYILETTLDTLTDDDVETFSRMVDEKKSPLEIQQFIQSHISDYPGFMNKILETFQQRYLND